MLVAFAATCFATEMTPLVFGTGYDAVFDWGFPYVTLHFIVLPVVALLAVAYGIEVLFEARACTDIRTAWTGAGLLALGIVYLLTVTTVPMPLVSLSEWIHQSAG